MKFSGRQKTELNSHVCLLVSQLSFLASVALIDYAPEELCLAITYVNHFLWLATFTWLGMKMVLFEYLTVMYKLSL